MISGQKKISILKINSLGVVYINPDGIAYNLFDNELKKSYDNGLNWNSVIFNNDFGGILFIDSKKNIFIGSKLKGKCPGLYLFVNETELKCSLNLSYFDTCPDIGAIWSITEDKEGNLHAGLYSFENWTRNCAYIFKSSDNGKSWKISYNSSNNNWTGRHIHNVKFNPYNDYIYAAQGDGYNRSRLLRSKDYGERWETIQEDVRANYMAMEFTKNYRIFGEDFAFDIENSSRIMRTSNDINFEEVFQLAGNESANWWASGKTSNGNVIFGTAGNNLSNNYALYLSSDEGKSWEKIKDFGKIKGNWTGIMHISNLDSKGYLYIYDTSNKDLIKIKVD